MKTLLEVLQAGTDYLARQGCDEARATMQHLLAHVLHCNRTALYSQFDRPVEEAELAPLRELLKRRAAGEPLQHLLGVTEFFRRDFLTDARALIPRPETEELVEMVLKKIPDHPVRILDMGTGSGVIGVTLALELKERAGEVVLADISPQALDLALENAMRLGARVSTIQTNLFANIPQEKTDPYAEDVKPVNGRNVVIYRASLEHEKVRQSRESVMPDLYMSQEDSSEMSLLKTNVMDVQKEYMVQFITGAKDIDAEWDGYISALNNVGLERYLELLQKAYDESSFAK